MRLSSDMLRLFLPILALAALLATVFWLRPNTMGYTGLHLLFKLALPIALATLSQMVILSVNDIDLSTGPFVSFVTCVTATFLVDTPWLGVLILLASIAAYAAIGMIIAWRQLPAIVVTLGMSFVWSGFAVLMLPSPGGTAPSWIAGLTGWRPPIVPFGVLATVVVMMFGHWLIMRSALGVLIRGVGGNERSVARAGWSVLRARGLAYAVAGGFGVLSGMSLTGIMTSGDANMAVNYTLLSIAGAILGGCEFMGGRVSAVGAVFGAATLLLATSVFTFMRVPPDWQIGAQGLILIAVLAVRIALDRMEATR